MSSQTDGAAAVLSRGRRGEIEKKSGGATALHNTTVYTGGEIERERKPVDLRISPCFTSQLCLDKPHSTCVITTDTVTFSRHKFRPRLGD